MTLKKNDHFVAIVEDIISDGLGVVKKDGFPLFVDGTIMGEEVEVRAIFFKKNFGYGRLIKILKESPHRVEMRDDIGRQIGTMTYQHMDYSEQLRMKEKFVRDSFKRIGKFENPKIHAVIGMENPWAYRNKAQIPVREMDGQLETGFFRKGSNELVPVENFHIQHPEIDKAILIVRDLLREYELKAYNPKEHTGLIRHIIVKRGFYTGEMMIVLVVNQEKIPHEERIVEEIRKSLPEVVSIMKNVNKSKGNRILGRKNVSLWGKTTYKDIVLGKTFEISTDSFFQVNTKMAEKLYEKAFELAAFTGEEVLLDAYSGIGMIGILASDFVKKTYGVDIVRESIEQAKENGRLNGVENIEYFCEDATVQIKKWKKSGQKFDTVFVDPPKKGLDREFVEQLIKLAPQKIVNISCNPATLARDCKIFCDEKYELIEIQPVDLFPQTPHVECVALLRRTNM